MLSLKNCFVTLMVLVFLVINCNSAFAGGSDPPNLIVNFTLKYLEPQTGEVGVYKTYKTSSTDEPRTFEVPAGVYMVLLFDVANVGGGLGGDGVSVDIWMDWPYETLPGDSPEDDADIVCIPEGPSDCFHIMETIKADLNYEGKEGKGIYNIFAWVDRFDWHSEDSKDDNYLGVKIIVRPIIQLEKEPLTIQQSPKEEPQLADSPWPMKGHDLKHTGRSPYLGAQAPFKKWEFLTGGRVRSSPAIGSDGTIYVGSYDDNLYAINPDGTKKWECITEGDGDSSPAIGVDGTIYIGSWEHSLYAVNPDGTKKWEYLTEGNVVFSPTIGSDGTIYVSSNDDKLYAINPDGTKKWEFPTGDIIRSSPAIGSDGTIYIGSFDRKLYAINPDGTKKWEFRTGGYFLGGYIRSSPAIGSDGTIYVGSTNNKLYAINPDGTKKWEFRTGMNVDSSPAIGSDGTIYVGSNDGKLYAINPDGTKKWEFPTGSYANYSSPAIGSDGTIYVGSGKLYAINPDGTKKWEFRTGDWISSSPAIGSDGTIYVGSNDKKLYAIGGITGITPPTKIFKPKLFIKK